MDDSGRGSLESEQNKQSTSQATAPTNILVTIAEETTENPVFSNMAATNQPNQPNDNTMSNQGIEHRVTILGEDNYLTWKWQMEFILQEKGLLELVKTSNSEGYIPTKKDLQASSILASSLSQLNMQRVINCKTANQIWTALEASFENKSMTERTMLMDQFTSFKIKNIKDVSIEIGMIQSLANRLKTLGATVDDQMIISILLKALPESLKTWKATWKMVNAEKPSLNNLITGVMAEISEMKEPTDSALIATSSTNPWKEQPNQQQKTMVPYYAKKPSRNQKSKGTNCFYCDKPGHWAYQCMKKQRDASRIQGHKRNNVAMMAVTLSKIKTKGFWIADSGCSTHMTPVRDWFQEYNDFSIEKPITLGNGSTIPAKGMGKIRTEFGTMNNVHYVPELSANLFSISAAADNNIVSKYYKDNIELFKDNILVLKGRKVDGVYTLEFKTIIEQEAALTAVSINEWHRRFAHTPKEIILRMAKNGMVEHLEIDKTVENNGECVDCIMGKCKHTTHKNRTTKRTQQVGASLHFDTVGPFKETSLGGAKYLLLGKDEASSYRFGKAISTKSEIPEQVKKIISMTELQTKNKVLQVKTDNGSEFRNNELKLFLNEKGINHETSVPYVPQQNGLIERDVRTVIETARTLLYQSGLPKSLWAEAINTTIYVLNRTPNTMTIDKTPYELWFGKKPSVKNLHTFGQKAVVMFRDYERSKWNQKGLMHHFVGYTNTFNTFRFYDPECDEVYVSCDATFLKNDTNIEAKLNTVEDDTKNVIIPAVNTDQEITESNENLENELSWYDEIVIPEQDEQEVINKDVPSEQDKSNQDTQSDEEMATEIAPLKVLRKPKIRSQPYTPIRTHQKKKSHSHQELLRSIGKSGSKSEKKYARREHTKAITDPLKASDIHPGHILPSKLRKPKERLHAKLATLEADEEPKTFSEAMERNDSNKWVEAMQEEMKSLNDNDVYELVERPDHNVVTNKWVYKIKRDAQGNVTRYKARLVARGFSQIYGVDYLDTYAPVANMSSIRMLFAFAAREGLKMSQFDIKTAFLYGELKETVYMEQPEGFIKDDNKVCLLKRSLYGLKQSPRQWNHKFTDFLESLNLIASEHDGCVFYKKNPLLIITIYVDDGIIFAEDTELIDQTMIQLRDRFEVHSCNLSTFLGFQVYHRTDETIGLHQTKYIKTILKRFNMEDSKPVDSPISPTQKYDTQEPLDPETPYREAVGSLMYAAVITRLDIIHAVTKVAQKVANPTKEDWIAVKRIFRYLREKENFSIEYKKTGQKNLTVYCDADFAGDNDTSRSTTGAVYLYGDGPIHWKSQRQALITLSSTEAEFVSICSTTKEIIWLRKLAKEINMIDERPTKILCDNQSAIKIATNEKSIHRTRHMAVQANYPREQIDAGEIEIIHVKGDNQLADMLTKPTTIKKFIENRNQLMQTIVLILQVLLFMLNPTFGANTYFFNRVSPLVFEPVMNVFVETGTTQYDLDLTYDSPCNTIPTDKTHQFAKDHLKDDDYRMYNVIAEDCKQMFEEQWTTRVQELILHKNIDYETTNSTILVRAKRNPFLLLWIGVPILVTITTNLITTVSSYYVPYGDSAKINNVIGWIKSQEERDKARVEKLIKKVQSNG